MVAEIEHLYISTYCQHVQHEDCRLHCKICFHRCLCPCHNDGIAGTPATLTEDHEAWLRRAQTTDMPASRAGVTDAVAGA